MTTAVAVQQHKIGTPVVLMPQNMDEVLKSADFLAKSALIPQGLRGKPADVAVIVMQGMELGIGPMQALQNIACVNGKPTSEGKLLLALIQSRCPEAKIEIETSPTKATVKMTRGQNSYTAVWDIERARKLGLMDKPNYKSQPETMLKWRAVADAARTLFSDVVLGLLTNDEAEDVRADENGLVDEKSKRIQDKLAAAREVKSEVSAPTAAEPAAASSEPAQSDSESEVDPVGGYLITADCPLKGKKIRDIPIPVLQGFVDAIEAKAKKTGKSVTGPLLEAATRIQQWIDMNRPAEQTGFESFDGEIQQ